MRQSSGLACNLPVQLAVARGNVTPPREQRIRDIRDRGYNSRPVFLRQDLCCVGQGLVLFAGEMVPEIHQVECCRRFHCRAFDYCILKYVLEVFEQCLANNYVRIRKRGSILLAESYSSNALDHRSF